MRQWMVRRVDITPRKTSSVTELGLANCQLGPSSLAKLAEYVYGLKECLRSETDLQYDA